MELLTSDAIKNICHLGKQVLKEEKIAIIYNVVGFTKKADLSQEDSDFFSNKEIGEIFDSLIRLETKILPFSDELEFVRQAIDDTLPSNLLIWNLSRQGSDNNKKSLITSLADFMGLNFIGSSVYTMNLCRHKFDFQKVIDSPLINVPISQFVGKYSEDIKFIIKPEKGSASRGMKREWANLNAEQVLKIVTENDLDKNSSIIQQYIPGFEVEVPIIQYNGKFLVLGIAGIQKEEKIFFDTDILEEEMYDTKYTFYDFQQYIRNPKLCNAISEEAVRIAKLTEIKDYGRIDFRIDYKRNFYCFDISTTPYLTEHSSFNYLLQEENFSHSDLLALIIGSYHSNIEYR